MEKTIMDCVIGCDVGSQGVKAVLLNAEGRTLGEAGTSYTIDYPQPTWAEQPAEVWISAIATTIKRLMATVGVTQDQVRAIGMDAQVDGFVPIDANGKPLRPAIIWMDRRAVPQVESARKLCEPERVFRLSGLNFDPYHVAPKIRWFAENQPELYERTAHFLLPGSYVAYYLTGELGVDFSNASSTLLMDVQKKTWSVELCDCFKISADKLTPIFPATHILGTLRKEAADALGLSPKTSVVLGCGDEHAACLGAGVVMGGLACDIAGTAEPVCAASPSPLFDPTGLVETHCHAHPDLWLMENPGFVSGGNYRWFRDQFSPEETKQAAEINADVYELLNRLAGQAPPGCQGLVLLPCLMGSVTPVWNANMRGTFLGFTLTHGREHFVRAILEASAYALRDITDQMQKIGLQLKEIRAVGGGARSELWRQIKADVTGLPVSMLETVETTAFGAAMLALTGSGLATSLYQAVEATVRVVETRDPDIKTKEIYEEYYQFYRSAFFALLSVYDKAPREQI